MLYIIENVKIGAPIEIKVLDVDGIILSLLSNFKASAIACNNPEIPTTLGPLLRCIDANILRSITVKKATDNKIGKIIGKNFIQSLLNKNKINTILSFKLKKKNIHCLKLYRI